ncbi:MAG TPA: aldo/keto reductase [Abditibacteriaceae bacterium]|jgi:hypothetical protein
MEYRRFGRTDLQMSVITCGGMRFQQGWTDLSPEEIEVANQENLEATVHRALEVGVNHIETARGYGTSEMMLGKVLPSIPREKLIVQTKVGPSDDPKEFRANFEKSMAYLKLDHVDLLAFHGVNTLEVLDQVLRKGGCMEVAREIQREGRANFIGFSTHGTEPMISQACATGEFDYVNLHWYYVNDLNWPSVLEARKQDMGVFIISPVDKGGKLYEPPAKLVDLCAPLSPMQFNDLYCLARPEVHTLSIGAARPSDFDQHVEALKYRGDQKLLSEIEARLRAEMERTLGADWCARWPEGIPEHLDVPGDVNVREILRLWTYAKSLDLVEWGKMRYNLLGNAGHWFPGHNAKDLDEAALAPVIAASPFADKIPGVLREAHELMFGEEKKRLSQSD